jgi:hypothetical protein
VDGEDRLKRLAQELEKSLERAIGSSPQVEECLERFKAEGYDVAVYLDVTLAYAPRGELEGAEADRLAGQSGKGPFTFKMSALDKKFLRSLKIAVDEEPS